MYYVSFHFPGPRFPILSVVDFFFFYQSLVFSSSWIKLFIVRNEEIKIVPVQKKKYHKIYRILNIERVQKYISTKTAIRWDGMWVERNREQLIVARLSLNNTLHPKLNPVNRIP